MIIDLHNHTKIRSVCSELTLEELVKRARQLGIEGVCVTEHDMTWDADALKEAMQTYQFPVFGGVEVKTNHGHILVFGLKEFDREFWRIEKLRRVVDEAGGVMIAAHPIRTVSRELPVSKLAERPLFSFVDEIEVYNGASSDDENNIASQVGRFLNYTGVGGSDAHSVNEVGRCVTVFEKDIENEAQLVVELKAKRFKSAPL